MLLTSCQGDIFVKAEPTIVVEGWICNDEFPVVFVSTTIPLSTEKQKIDSIGQYVLNWAKVTVSDGERSVKLTGRINSRYTLPCYFTTSYMRGEAGKTYTIDVDYANYHAHAVTCIQPQPATVEDFEISKQEGSDSLYAIHARVARQSGGSGYYKFLVGVEGEDNDYFSSYMGLFTNQNIGEEAMLPVFRSHHIKREFVSNFKSGETVHIKFASIDKQAYNFWSDYEDYISMGTNLLFPANNSLPSNIEGGLGYWHGYSATSYTVQIP